MQTTTLAPSTPPAFPVRVQSALAAVPSASPAPEGPVDTATVGESVEEMIRRVNREIREQEVATQAAQLEVSKKALSAWQTQNPWNTVGTSLPAAMGFVWALGKSLSKKQKRTLQGLIKAGIPAGYARQLVERDEGDMIGYMMAHPAKKKK